MQTPNRHLGVWPRALCALLLCCALCAGPAATQTLAHPGWAGNGVSLEPWWRRAVFYRIDTGLFQDSDGDGRGDIPGLIQRLDYLQSLGVDALVLHAAVELRPDDPGVEELFRSAAAHRLRVLVSIGAPESQSPEADALYLGLARAWLNQGAAGVYVPTAQLAAVDGTGHVARLLHDLRGVCNGFPGERVLLADAAPTVDAELESALAKETQLTASKPMTFAQTSAADLRVHLLMAMGESAAPLLQAERVPALENGRAEGKYQQALGRTVAAMLLGSRSAVLLDAGQELGLLAPAETSTLAGLTPAASTPASPALARSALVMQWTPTNVTRKPPPPAAEPEAPEAVEAAPAYSGFKAYNPPPRRDLFPPPEQPLIFVVDDPHNPVLDPDALPGFTSGTLDAATAAGNAATANVAVEDGDGGSLLNFYRHLIQLHHDNVALRNGVQTMVDRDAEDVLVWVRRAPAGSVTAANVVVVCNLSEKAVTLDLSKEVSGRLRVLVSAPTMQGQGVEKLVVLGYGVFVGAVGKSRD